MFYCNDILAVTGPELTRRLGDGVRVMKQYSGLFDTFPLSFLTVQSVEGLPDLAGQALLPLRFRPNLLINTGEPAPLSGDN